MQLISIKAAQDKERMGGKGDPLGIVQEIKFDSVSKWYIHKAECVQENETRNIL